MGTKYAEYIEQNAEMLIQKTKDKFEENKEEIRQNILDWLDNVLDPIPTHYHVDFHDDYSKDNSGELVAKGTVRLNQTVENFLKEEYTGNKRASYTSGMGWYYVGYDDEFYEDIILKTYYDVSASIIKETIEQHFNVKFDELTDEELYAIEDSCVDCIYTDCVEYLEYDFINTIDVYKMKLGRVVKMLAPPEDPNAMKIEDNTVTKGGNYETVVIPDGVTEIGLESFWDCTNVTKVVIPDSVTTIGGYAFERCSNIESIEIPDSVTSIGEYAFAECTKLKKVKLPSNIKEIETGVFENCYSLQDITIPNGVIEIGPSAFFDCESLENIIIPDSVKTICDSAFQLCQNLKKVTLGKNLKYIERLAFDDCASLEHITIPNSVADIEQYAFRDCVNLKSITLPQKFRNEIQVFLEAVINLEEIIFTYESGSSKKINLKGNKIENFGEKIYLINKLAKKSRDARNFIRDFLCEAKETDETDKTEKIEELKEIIEIINSVGVLKTDEELKLEDCYFVDPITADKRIDYLNMEDELDKYEEDSNHYQEPENRDSDIITYDSLEWESLKELRTHIKALKKGIKKLEKTYTLLDDLFYSLKNKVTELYEYKNLWLSNANAKLIGYQAIDNPNAPRYEDQYYFLFDVDGFKFHLPTQYDDIDFEKMKCNKLNDINELIKSDIKGDITTTVDDIQQLMKVNIKKNILFNTKYNVGFRQVMRSDYTFYDYDENDEYDIYD